MLQKEEDKALWREQCTLTQSQSRFFFFPKEREIFGFLIIYLKNYIHVLKM